MIIGIALLIGFVVADYYIFRSVFRMFFEDMDDFFECVRFDFQPDLFSFFKGELKRDWEAEFRLGTFFFLCGAVVFIEFLILKGIFS
ncbi:hypothetical protein [Pontibacillus marinus]|uniref:Uncharacterized protein n=1 Tax=Pontibacillus marinus BH030004 = DSM 16465 TaxID=1385511 RepID=A0A0A5HVI7_9BACI|nr:hypothetical protein [Pontibacillus marinus]KGX87662.1 hypothetical protein N783_09600 [Pontibacillus marinus BH030004 = DSM 16465]